MSNHGVDPQILNAWLSARSIARGLPLPIPACGGFRVDTNSDSEVARWVFPRMGPGLEELARSISEPLYLLKLCGAADELRAVLPTGWQLYAPGYFMRATCAPTARPLPDGYAIKTKRIGTVLEAQIFFETGVLAASGYAVETHDVFIYDRIVTEPAHRRKGLGHALMLTLHAGRHRPNVPELLVATEDGQALYSALGWITVSPYSTASVATP
ncbi:GNAT family N-acetyltransferase [Sphingomonas sp. M1-B02]|uniref:GNAT family N-acetyltransferase n=1 Tax=Sphingomonas sp. M1-B02 TaxID=3114300 RepID=UPI0022408D96|nr:GNAT family N-acetyltransferase [Sphingomonas sp. S6-11]UZK64644.1 GNAT family N-acetyltransferase [Sphingomonas sp. S6-11]